MCVKTKEKVKYTDYYFFFHCCSWCVISKSVFLRISPRWQDYYTYLMFIPSLALYFLLPQGCCDLYSCCCCTERAANGTRKPIGEKQCCAPVRVSPKPYEIQLLVSVLSTGFCFLFSVKA